MRANSTILCPFLLSDTRDSFICFCGIGSLQREESIFQTSSARLLMLPSHFRCPLNRRTWIDRRTHEIQNLVKEKVIVTLDINAEVLVTGNTTWNWVRQGNLCTRQ